MGGPLLSIQYLRALAALMVVVYHATRWTKPNFDIGAAGVDIFFVISGFILWTVANEKPVTAWTFLTRRWVRVAPLYWVLTLFVAAVAAVWPWVFWDAKPTWEHLLLSLAFIQHLNQDGEPFPVLTIGWSLNYEAAFYLIFAVSLLARRRLATITLLLAAVPVFGIAENLVFPANRLSSPYYLGANMMFLQFIAGVWLAHWRFIGALPGRRMGMLLIAVGVVGFAWLYLSGVHSDLMRPLLWGIPAFAIVCGAVCIETDGGLPQVPVLKLLGDASYSLYLAHFITVALLNHVMDSARLVFAPVAIAASLVAGLACYFALERPMSVALRGLSRRTLPSRAA